MVDDLERGSGGGGGGNGGAGGEEREKEDDEEVPEEMRRVEQSTGIPPILLIHSENDEVVPLEHGKTLYANASAACSDRECEFWIVPDTHHIGAYFQTPMEYNRRVVGFFDRAFSSSDAGDVARTHSSGRASRCLLSRHVRPEPAPNANVAPLLAVIPVILREAELELEVEAVPSRVNEPLSKDIWPASKF